VIGFTIAVGRITDIHAVYNPGQAATRAGGVAATTGTTRTTRDRCTPTARRPSRASRSSCARRSAGFTRTDLVGSLLHTDKAKGLRRQVPLRDFADVDQIAEVIAFVAGPAASHMTGALIRVDGGFGAQLGLGRIGG
jgi:NAD(P)-dependent dehydrogenase (short-subunit alcohol dehydrogenase family)